MKYNPRGTYLPDLSLPSQSRAPSEGIARSSARTRTRWPARSKIRQFTLCRSPSSLKKMLISYFAKHTGKSEEEVEKDMERDRFMSATEAVEYGVVDEVFSRSEDEQSER